MPQRAVGTTEVTSEHIPPGRALCAGGQERSVVGAGFIWPRDFPTPGKSAANSKQLPSPFKVAGWLEWGTGSEGSGLVIITEPALKTTERIYFFYTSGEILLPLLRGVFSLMLVLELVGKGLPLFPPYISKCICVRCSIHHIHWYCAHYINVIYIIYIYISAGKLC